MLSIDPLASSFASQSPYVYGANRVIDGIDREGMSWERVTDDQGNITGFRWTTQAPNNTTIFAMALHISDHGTYSETTEFNIGSSTMTVYGDHGSDDITTFDGSSYPARLNDYATVQPGLYKAQLGLHKSDYLALRMSRLDGSSRIPLMNDHNPSNNLTYATGINIHKAGLNDKTGLTTTGSPCSAGCQLITRGRWDEFINKFNYSKQRNQDRLNSVGLTRSTFINNFVEERFSANPNVGISRMAHYNWANQTYESILTGGNTDPQISGSTLAWDNDQLTNPWIGVGIQREYNDDYTFPTAGGGTTDMNGVPIIDDVPASGPLQENGRF